MPRGVPIDPEERDALRARLTEGYRNENKTIRELMDEVGLSYGSVHHHLAQAGVLRPRGRRKGRRYGANTSRETAGIPSAPRRPPPVDDQAIDDELRAHLFSEPNQGETDE